jgi:hypothetical protein
LVSNLTRIVNTVPNFDVPKQAAAEVAKLRQKYAQYLSSAPDDNLKKYLVSLATLHSAVLEQEGAAKCNQLAKEGPLVLDAEKYRVQLSSTASELFTAISMAITLPSPKGAPTDQDYDTLRDKMLLLGVPSVYLDLIAKPDFSDEKYCPALISMLSNVVRLDGDAGNRIRADFAKAAAQ